MDVFSEEARRRMAWERNFDSYFADEDCYDEIYGKHFKKYYAGKPTKRILRWMIKIEVGDCLSHLGLERILLS